MKQIDFEIKSHQDAIQKLKKQVQRAKEKAYFSSTLQARATIKDFAIPTANLLVKYYEEISKGRQSSTASAAVAEEMLEWFKYVDAEAIAAILLKSVFDMHGIFDRMTTAKAASFIGTRVEDEARFRYYELTAPSDVVDAMRRRVTTAGSSPKYRRLSTKIITEKMLTEKHNREDLLWNKWTDAYKNTIGLSLLDIAMKLGLITKTNVKRGKKTYAFIDISPEAKAIQEQVFSKACEHSYLAYPLIEPPMPWQYIEGQQSRYNTTGGYHSEWIREQLPMTRGRHYRSEFGRLSTEFLNMLGNTTWMIDHNMVQVGKRLLDKKQSVGSFIAMYFDPRLEGGMPSNLLELDKQHPERVAWREMRHELWELHQKRKQQSVRSTVSINLAQEFLKYPRFYLSWSNDSRGRCYAQQPWLSPHSTDAEKSLLKFADGCKMDKRAEWWAAQAIGAAYLGSRKNLEDRVQWTYDNAELITAVAEDAFTTSDIWSQAKDKWQFVQLACEWHKVVLTKQEHLWHTPIGADATASGLQLLSSMLRDPVGMKYSNVLPPTDASAPPEDSYMAVLGIAKQMAASNPDTEHLVEHMRFRAIGKTTMVMLYGATFITVRDRVIKVFQDEGLYPDIVSKKDCGEITKLVQSASRQVFPAGFAALDWLAKLAKLAVKNGSEELCWHTPSNDYIKIREYKYNSHDINTSHLGRVRVATGEGEPDVKKIQTSLSPNFIHSYDQSLLKVSFSGWDKPLAVIHDCIKVLPSDMDSALDRIRRGFHTICQGNPLDRLATELGVDDKQLPRLTQGDGDITKVLDSVYLFN